MHNDPAQISQRIRLGGIKLSPELASFSSCRSIGAPCTLTQALSSLASRQIPLTYFSLARGAEHIRISCCVERQYQPIAEEIFQSSSSGLKSWQSRCPVGTMTLFPHRQSLALLGRTIACLGLGKLPLFSGLSSISALSLNTEYSLLDECTGALKPVVELPENHAPMRQQSLLVNMVETVAVYWEPVIRVYGFDIRRDVTLLELTVDIETLAVWGNTLAGLAAHGLSFLQVLIDRLDQRLLRLCLVMDSGAADQALALLQPAAASSNAAVRSVRQLEMLCFHGPHFQDRYGIAHALFRSLDHSPLTLHMVGCTGTSISLLLEKDEAEQAKTLLAGDFVVP